MHIDAGKAGSGSAFFHQIVRLWTLYKVSSCFLSALVIAIHALRRLHAQLDVANLYVEMKEFNICSGRSSGILYQLAGLVQREDENSASHTIGIK